MIHSQVQQPYPYSTDCGVMQRRAGLGFAATWSLDVRPVRAKDVQDLAESRNWMEPYDMNDMNSGGGLMIGHMSSGVTSDIRV